MLKDQIMPALQAAFRQDKNPSKSTHREKEGIIAFRAQYSYEGLESKKYKCKKTGEDFVMLIKGQNMFC